MKNLLESVNNLKADTSIRSLINKRMEEFGRNRISSKDDIFKEMCFCIMTANCSAEKCLEVYKEMENGFLNLPEISLSQKFKELGYRFPNIRANYIVQNRKHVSTIFEKIKNQENDDKKLREWLVKTIKGLGYKEASHFLRNMGSNDCAIIDFHIVDLLVKNKLIERPKTITKKKYLEIEGLLTEIASNLNLNCASLDLYLWYLETGKILK